MWSVVFALLTLWVAIASSYLTNLPIGFFVGTLSAAVYVVARAIASRHARRSRRRVA
jgi:zinc/manganese transport system permease protein